MIYTEEGLKKTQELVADLERSLEELRRSVLPINEQKYHIMAAGCISQIRQMREEIDEYLGIVPYNVLAPGQQVPVLA